MISKKYINLVFLTLSLLGGCKNPETSSSSVDLNQIQKDFLQQIGKEGVEESPFHLQYTLQTVFFSQEVISLFGEVLAYDAPPSSGWKKYEGKTLCKIGGQFREVSLTDLVPLQEQKEFLREYCERSLKAEPLSYFATRKALRDHLSYEEIAGFIIDEKGLVLFFQPYSVGREQEAPFYVKIPYEYLQGKWNALHPLPTALNHIFSSQSYTACWDDLIMDFDRK